MNEVITLGGGCFWCTEALFLELRGVEKVESGYSGGTLPNPRYSQVSSGTTGHAEVIQITFDPTLITLHDLLIIFFTLHNPTTLNQQGADTGTQYRSVVFYRNAQQQKVIEQVIAEITEQAIWADPIVTEVAPFTAFYPAEAEHQRYYERNGEQPYCRVVIDPKVAKLRKLFQDKLKKAA